MTKLNDNLYLQISTPGKNNEYLRNGDSLKLVDQKLGKVHTLRTLILEEDKPDTYHAVLLDPKDKNVTIDLGSNKYQRSPLTWKQIKHDLENSGRYKTQHPNFQERKMRNKYPDWPFKRVKSLTNSNNRPNMNYEICEGKILDPELVKKLGTDHAYYQKALKNFDINLPNAGKTGVHTGICKGQVSGPIVLSSDEKRAENQLQNLKDQANTRFMKNKKLGHAAQKQNFWLDSNSYLKGDVELPVDGFMINSQVNSKNMDDTKRGLVMENSWLHNSQINNQANGVILNSGLENAEINNKNAVFLSESNFVDGKINNFENTNLINSYVEQTDLNDGNRVTDSSIVKYGSGQNKLQDCNMSNSHFILDTHDILNLKGGIIKNKRYNGTIGNRSAELGTPTIAKEKPHKEAEDDFGPDL